ncbi:MAG: flagellar hook-associated protein FlgL [Caldimonas sp.]
MRIATANAFDAGIDTLMSRQADLSEAQVQLASGKRVTKASDDPAAAARAEHALAGILRSDTSQRAVDAARTAMSQTETALSDAGDLLQQAREAIIAAGNASYGEPERQSLAEQLKAIRSQLLAVANRSDGAGTYLFAGQGVTQKPFADAPGGVQFVATTGQLATERSTALPLSSDGSAAWMSAPTGNGVFETRASTGVTNATIDNGQVVNPALLTGSDYTLQFASSGGTTTYAVMKDGLPTAVTAAPYVSGQSIDVDGMRVSVKGAPANGDQFQIAPSTPTLSVFATLDRAIADLSTPGRTNNQIAQSTADGLRDMDSVMGTMQEARSLVGAMLNRADSETSRLASAKLISQTEQSAAEDLDMVEAISAFQAKQSGYDAALKSYSMVQRLSLFQYLSG